jgi:hypothetical protein
LATGDDDDFDDFQSATATTTATSTAASATARPLGNSLGGLFDAPVQPTAARGTMPTTQPNYSSLPGFNLSSSSAQPLRSNPPPPPSQTQSSFGMGVGMGMTSPSNLGFSSTTPASGFTSSAANYQPNYFSQPTTTATVPPLPSIST